MHSDHKYYIEVKCQGQVYSKSIIWLVNSNKKEGKDQESIQSSTTPDPGYQWESDNSTSIFLLRVFIFHVFGTMTLSYMVCRLHWRFQITNMTLESKVRVS